MPIKPIPGRLFGLVSAAQILDGRINGATAIAEVHLRKFLRVVLIFTFLLAILLPIRQVRKVKKDSRLLFIVSHLLVVVNVGAGKGLYQPIKIIRGLRFEEKRFAAVWVFE